MIFRNLLNRLGHNCLTRFEANFEQCTNGESSVTVHGFRAYQFNISVLEPSNCQDNRAEIMISLELRRNPQLQSWGQAANPPPRWRLEDTGSGTPWQPCNAFMSIKSIPSNYQNGFLVNYSVVSLVTPLCSVRLRLLNGYKR